MILVNSLGLLAAKTGKWATSWHDISRIYVPRICLFKQALFFAKASNFDSFSVKDKHYRDSFYASHDSSIWGENQSKINQMMRDLFFFFLHRDKNTERRFYCNTE